MFSIQSGPPEDITYAPLHPGDWLLLQFGHNDEKRNWPQTYVEPFKTHKAYLRAIIAEARLRGAMPVLITPMERRAGIEGNTHGEFPASIMETAREENVPVIDLWSMSKKLYAAMGEQVGEAFADPTHHLNYGAYELAKCVVQGIKDNKLPLADHVVGDFGTFDPAHPDPFASFRVPASAGRMEIR